MDRVVCAWALGVVGRVRAGEMAVAGDGEGRGRAHAVHRERGITRHCQVRAALQLALAAALARPVVVVVRIVIVAIADVVCPRVGVARKVLRSTRVFFAVVAQMALDHVVYVGRAVLVELYMVPRAFLEDDDRDVDGAENAELVRFFEEAILAL